MQLVQGPHSQDKGGEELVSYIPLVSKAFSQGNFGAFPPCSFLSALTNGIPEPSLENKAGEKELQEGKNMEMNCRVSSVQFSRSVVSDSATL